MSEKKSFSERLKLARDESGLSVELAAMTINVEPEKWQDWEDGNTEPDAREGLAICVLLQVIPDYLWEHPR